MYVYLHAPVLSPRSGGSGERLEGPKGTCVYTATDSARQLSKGRDATGATDAACAGRALCAGQQGSPQVPSTRGCGALPSSTPSTRLCHCPNEVLGRFSCLHSSVVTCVFPLTAAQPRCPVGRLHMQTPSPPSASVNRNHLRKRRNHTPLRQERPGARSGAGASWRGWSRCESKRLMTPGSQLRGCRALPATLSTPYTCMSVSTYMEVHPPIIHVHILGEAAAKIQKKDRSESTVLVFSSLI